MLSRFSTLGCILSGVWVGGGVSLLMDISSEMIHSLLPLFMVTTLGASVLVVGLIEGLAEATALMVKVFSGVISGWLGKGIRGALRDALVADVTPPELRGAAFCLRQSLDTIGAFLGPLLTMGLMLLWQNDFRAIFWVAVIPGLMAVALLFLGVCWPCCI